ncbi:TonB-dependent receptor [Chitinophaga sp. Cy-1792]|uniref:TonB-dependent receptor n=1 Tax=Chitinophaga sp. Cy-1792 TaxID=2608339 RepID=UPI0014219EF5|nr:TonB-dependent receptor [Chitinophaga sp. Cy-1792]NIG56777.1 TonB-dependent receptor [Chitinophaga sp. Cy-1792]
MKWSIVLNLVLCLQISAKSYSQNISISENKIAIKTLFKKIEQQSSYQFFFKEKLLQDTHPVDVHVANADIKTLLSKYLPQQGLTFEIVDKIVVIKPAENTSPFLQPLTPENIRQLLQGTVKDEDGQLLVGATVRIQSSGKGTTTNTEGRFTLDIPTSPAILEISFLGYETLTVPYTGQQALSITLKRKGFKADELVVVGYGTQKKTQLIGSVSQVTGKDINNRPVPNITQALTGQMPGVSVIQRTGAPGSAGTIQIRGVGSFGASTEALVLVDGIPTNSFNDIDPNDIESISVLKDASSAAIYGARAANGVVLVTTKTGGKQKMKVSYNGYVGMQKITATPDFVNSWEYAQMVNEAQPGSYTADQIAKFKDGSDPDNYPNTNWIDATFKKHFMQTGHNVSLSNGNDNTQYMLSLGYLNQDGVVAKNDYKKYSARFNLQSNITSTLKLTTRLSYIQSNLEQPNTPATLDATSMTDIISSVVRTNATFPIKLSNGSWGAGVVNKGNPVSWLNSASFYKDRESDLNANARLDWFVIPDLKLSAIGGYTQTQGQTKNFLATQQINSTVFLSPSSLTMGTGYRQYKTVQGLAEYNKAIKQHEIAVLAGYAFEQWNTETLSAGRSNLPSNDLTELPLGDVATQTNGSNNEVSALRSFFGRIQYNFAHKYLFETNMRYDGSSRFPANKKNAFFPSAAIGWRISEEEFIKDKIKWLNELKIKGSYGTLGNQNIGTYPYQNTLTTGYNYAFGGVASPGAVRLTLNDTTLHWESTRTKDIGIDGALFNNKLTFSAAWFDRYTYDILVKPSGSVSAVLGTAIGYQNSGKLQNRGWEFTIGHKNHVGQVDYFVNGNFSITKNKVLDLGVGNVVQPNGLVGNGSNIFIGYPLNSYYGYVADGLFTDAADVAAWQQNNNMTAISPSPKPGDIRYKDISGPGGKPDGKVSADYDRVVLGSTIPKYNFGASLGAAYHGFDLSMMLQGVAGVKGRLDGYAGYALYSNGNVQRWQMDNRWTADNPNRNAKYPRMEIISNQGTGNTLTSSYWLLDGSYLRLKNVQLGYTFSKDLLKTINISSVRIFAAGENLHTWSHYRKGWDPEINTGGAYYPILANYTVGLNVTF